MQGFVTFIATISFEIICYLKTLVTTEGHPESKNHFGIAE